MAAELVRTLAPTLNGSGSVNVKAQQGHLLDSTPTSRHLGAQSVESYDSKLIRYNVHLNLPPGREEELLSDAEEREKWYHSFISGGKRTGIGSDKDPRIQHPWKGGRLVGFSAFLTREEALGLKEKDGFFYASPSIEIPFPRRPGNVIKKTSLYGEIDYEEYIYASDEIKEKMMAGPRQREKMRRAKMEKL